jgi:hypothetical protein
VPIIRIKDEIEYLYSKKQHLNSQVYHLHLLLANIWPQVESKIEDKLKKEMNTKYKTMNNKLQTLTEAQTTTTTTTTPQLQMLILPQSGLQYQHIL